MRFRGVALVLAALACACSGKEHAIPVTMNLDSQSCSTTFPEDVQLNCATAVGVSLWAGESDERLESTCADLPGTERTLQALPVLLGNVDLSTTADEPVRLEIGMFAPRSAGDGCPDVGDSEPDMVLYGDTEPTELSTVSRGLSIDIICVGVTIGEWEACATVCDEGYNTCSAEGYCQGSYDECVAACSGDADCMATCQTSFESCMVDECSAARNACLAECSGQAGCDTRCSDEHGTCLQFGACDGKYETCLLDCDAAEADDCAFVY